MGELLATIPWDGVSFTGLISFAIIALLRGWLIPKISHEREISILQARITELIAEKNEWKEAAQEAEKVADIVRKQNSELLELSRTSAHALNEIARKADDRHVRSDAH